MELSLDLSLAFVPKTISVFLGDVSRCRDRSEKLAMLEDFVKRLEDEMRKIEAFKRELPLCMLLINEAITRLKEETIRCMGTEDPPVIEEFILPKTNSEENGSLTIEKESCNKKNWMSSAQLWSTEPISRNEEHDRSVPDNPIQLQNQTNSERRGFMAFNGNSCVTKPVTKDYRETSQVASLSLMTPPASDNSRSGCAGGSCASSLQPQPQHLQQNQRKQRRCWSPELHRRFVDALQQLGGAQVATPKQIRELMQVEGLTNDEVKSHLQKYRLHVRRLSESPVSQADNKGSWMPQDQCGDESNVNLSQSGSPQGPLLLGGSTKGYSSAGYNSMDVEDEKSDCHSWKCGLHQQPLPEADVLS